MTKYLQENFPVYMEMISQALADLVQFTVKTWQKITDVKQSEKHQYLLKFLLFFRHFNGWDRVVR